VFLLALIDVINIELQMK